MRGLVSSPVALDLLLALTQLADGGRLAVLAAAAGVPLSTAQSAIRLLLQEGLVARDRGRRPGYRLRVAHPAADALVRLAAQHTAPEHALDVTLRANPAIEFAARDADGYLIVEAPLADPRALAAFERIAALAADRRRDLPRVVRYGHHDLVDLLRGDPAAAERAERATILKGDLARSFPVPTRLTRARGRRRPVRLRRPSPRALAAIARAHGLRRIRLFGSAARDQLGPASDVDVLVEAGPGDGLSLIDLVRLEAQLEELLHRHVDVVTPGGLRPDVRERIEREAVTLYG